MEKGGLPLSNRKPVSAVRKKYRLSSTHCVTLRQMLVIDSCNVFVFTHLDSGIVSTM